MAMYKNGEIPVGCVVMAAGNAARFGENKLRAVVKGKMLIERALDAVPTDRVKAVCVVTQYDFVAELAAQHGFSCVQNVHPERGISHTILLGTEALQKRCGAIVYQVADQPLLRRESVGAMLDVYQTMPDRIVAMAHGAVRGNPCVFPSDLFPELCSLSGDTGGSAVIRRHPERLYRFEAGQAELADVDTPEELQRLCER